MESSLIIVTGVGGQHRCPNDWCIKDPGLFVIRCERVSRVHGSGICSHGMEIGLIIAIGRGRKTPLPEGITDCWICGSLVRQVLPQLSPRGFDLRALLCTTKSLLRSASARTGSGGQFLQPAVRCSRCNVFPFDQIE